MQISFGEAVKEWTLNIEGMKLTPGNPVLGKIKGKDWHMLGVFFEQGAMNNEYGSWILWFMVTFFDYEQNISDFPPPS